MIGIIIPTLNEESTVEAMLSQFSDELIEKHSVEGIDRFITTMLEPVRPPNVVAATCPVYVYPEEETVLDGLYHRLHNLHVWFLNLLGLGTGRGECHVVKREEFSLVGGYNEQLAAGEDFDLFMKLARRGKIKFVRSLKLYESPRRYRKLGYLRVTLFWLLNALSIMFFRKSFSREWEPVR